MSAKTEINCDGPNCGNIKLNGLGWISAGQWFNGHNVVRVELYFGGEDQDPDKRLDFCDLPCLTAYLKQLDVW